MKQRCLAAVAVVIGVFCGPLAAAPREKKSDDVLTGLMAGHPRLLLTAADQKRIEAMAETDELLARLIEQNRANAIQMLRQRPVRYEIPDGKRLLGQSRRCIQRVAAMALAWRWTGQQPFADGALKDMRIAAGFKDWNPRHFLDTAEMTTALAIGYDWLFDVLEPADRKAIRQAIVRLGLREGLKIYERRQWWTRSDNNWNQVCNGGMILGALAVAEDEPELAGKIIKYALASIPRGLSVYQGSGAYPEGPGYWQYGTSYTAVTIGALETALGHDFDIHKAPGLDRTGLYRIHTIGPTGLYFNYADCGERASRPAAAMFLLARVFDQPLYAWWHRQWLARLIPPARRVPARSQDRFFPLEIAWYDPRGKTPGAEQLPLDALFKSRQDIVTMRSAWSDPRAVYVGFKAGDNRANHGHLDIGSFVLDADGVRWAVDLGSDDYNMPGYFGRNRWKYYRMTNHSHNTLVIDGQIQNPSARCEVTAYRSTPGRTCAVVDMSRAYEGQAQSVQRGIQMLQRRVVHIRDEIRSPVGPVRWAMVTKADVQLQAEHATLTQNGQSLTASILAPAGARFEVLSTRPPTAREKQNEGTRMLAVTLSPRGKETLVISILLSPGTVPRSAAPVTGEPLAKWPKQ